MTPSSYIWHPRSTVHHIVWLVPPDEIENLVLHRLMRSQLNPLSRVINDSRPALWLPPSDYPPQNRRTIQLSGVAALLNEVKTANEVRPPVTKTRLQIQREESQCRETQRRQELARQRAEWNPISDSNIHGDPYSTIIVARLRYLTTADDLRTEFSKFGSIEHIRVVQDRGYAFIAYNHPQAAKAALQNTVSGLVIHGRRIITDMEKGRTQKNWRPRRLGGGLGGRFSLARQKVEMQRAQHIQRNFKAQKRDSRGNLRSQDNSGQRYGREPVRKGMKRSQKYDPRRSPAPFNENDERLHASGTAITTSSAMPRHESGGRALRRYY